jgi:gamma-glutamylputrescine oxidase
VCVVGLGGSGLRALAALADLGHRVVGIDAGPVAAGAAGRNGGFLLAGMAPFHHDLVATVGRPLALELHRATAREIDRIAAETPAAVRLVGSLRVADSAEELADCEVQHDAMVRDGLPVERYDGPAGTGLRFPGDGALQPVARCLALAGRLADRGVALHEATPALDVRRDEVSVPGGRVRCGAVVVAVDGGLERLLPELRGRVRTARAQMLATAPTSDVRLPCPVYARWGYDYWQQLPDGRVVLGGLRDRFEAEEWWAGGEPLPTTALQRRLDAVLVERIGVRAPVTHRWAGGIAFTDDRLPVLEEVRDGVWVAGAYSGTGNVVGALCGEAAARRAVGAPSLWADLLDRRGDAGHATPPPSRNDC